MRDRNANSNGQIHLIISEWQGIMAKIKIESGDTERHYWMDVWRYREQFYFLAWRDILVRYNQPVINVAWALIRPLLTMVSFHRHFRQA